MTLTAPFPYFGSKTKVADVVWRRLGDVKNYVEPFFGSGAVLLLRPQPFDGTEIVNDLDGMISNFWRAVSADPDAVARHADWPINENDLHARHSWLVRRKESLQASLEGDPDYYDAKTAGWWSWGLSCWLGRKFCSGEGPWRSIDGKLVKGKGDKDNPGIYRQRIGLSKKQGVNGWRLNFEHVENEITPKATDIRQRLRALSDRLLNVWVCCGDWSRVCRPTPTFCQGLTGVFLDPPYATDRKDLYAVDSYDVALDVKAWAVEQGQNPLMRIALCGYEGEHEMPEDWSCYEWQTNGGYANASDKRGRINKFRERIWFSPYCLRDNGYRQLEMF